MNGTTLGRVGVLAFLAGASISIANAADMPLKAPQLPPPVWTWCGFYIGGDVGGYWADQNSATDPFLSPGFGAPAIGGAGLAGFGQTPTGNSLNSSGIIGGLYAGYNWQWRNVVAGVEGDYSFLNGNASNTQVSSATFSGVPVPDFNMTVTASTHWLASARARLGFTTGALLFYATGGAAWTNTSYTANAVSFNNPPAIVSLAGTTASSAWSGNKTGFVVGAGVEGMLLGSPNWIVRAEYLYYQFDGSTSSMTTLGNGVDVCAPGHCGWTLPTSKLDISTARVGISYKFGGGPIVY